VYAHKPLKADDSNNSFPSAMRIPNQSISWAAYEERDKSNPIDYYTFCFYKGEIQDQLSWA
jgi:hypothetical protein